MIFLGSCSGAFYAVDAATGRVRWSYDVKQDGNQSSFHGNPVLASDLKNKLTQFPADAFAPRAMSDKEAAEMIVLATSLRADVEEWIRATHAELLDPSAKTPDNKTKNKPPGK